LRFLSIGKGAVDLFFPADCLLCGSPLEPLNRSFICSTCWQSIEWLPISCCVKCGSPLPFETTRELISPRLCLNCQKKPPSFNRLFTPAVYKGTMAKIIKLFKYNHKRGIIRGLSLIINDYLDRFNFALLGLDAVVPVPLHPVRFRERGFNQAQDIAFVIGKHLNVEVWKNYLVRVKYTRAQTRLKKEERQRNIKDAFLVKEKGKGKGKTILLVDDVYTTGATLNEASKKIRQDGAEVFAFTLARTPEV